MKTFKFACCLFAIILVLSAFYESYLHKKSEEYLEYVEKAEKSVLQNDYSAALEIADTFMNNVENDRKVLEAIIPHSMIDEILSEIGEMREYLNHKSNVDFFVSCELLKVTIEHIYEKERFKLPNFL